MFLPKSPDNPTPPPAHTHAPTTTDPAPVQRSLPPVSIDDIAAVAKAGERLPEKTTFFSPKPRTGLVFRSLRDS